MTDTTELLPPGSPARGGAAGPAEASSSSAGPPIKTCAKCGTERPIIEFPARRTTCQPCRTAEKAARDAKRLERKQQVEYSPAVVERIVDAVSSGMTLTEIAAEAWSPTLKQISAWRRQHEEFRVALEEARASRADARSDKIDAALNDLRAGKITAADCRVIVETEMKMAALEAPARFSPTTRTEARVEARTVVETEGIAPLELARWLAVKLGHAVEGVTGSRDLVDARGARLDRALRVVNGGAIEDAEVLPAPTPTVGKCTQCGQRERLAGDVLCATCRQRGDDDGTAAPGHPPPSASDTGARSASRREDAGEGRQVHRGDAARFLLLPRPAQIEALGYLVAICTRPAETRAALRLTITAIARSALRWRTWKGL